MKHHKLRELGWTDAELARDKQAFFDMFQSYIARFGSSESNTFTESEDSDDDLLDCVARTSTPPPVYSSEAERYLGEPLLKKKDLTTYAKY